MPRIPGNRNRIGELVGAGVAAPRQVIRQQAQPAQQRTQESHESSPMTAAQRGVLAFVIDFKREYEMPPTRAEIARHFGWASANAAEDHLRALERRGLVRLKPGMSRGIFVKAGVPR